MNLPSFHNNNDYVFFNKYLNKLENTNEGKDLKNQLTQDSRFKELEGKLISNGSGAVKLETNDLAMWTLWAIERFGKKKAYEYLETFLTVDTVEIMITLWVLGIDIDSIINLDNNFFIVPITKLPPSFYKFTFLKKYFPFPSPPIMPNPKVVIVRRHKTPKIAEENGPGEKYWELLRQIRNIALLINLFDENYCVPYLATSFSIPEVPLGYWGGSGGGISHYDTWGDETTKFENSNINELKNLFHSFQELTNKKQKRFTRILERFSQAKRSHQIEDQILDLGISLEMALLGDTPKEQLALHFRLRGSWLLGKNSSERTKLYTQLRDIYEYRSQVAHSGTLKTKSLISVRDNFNTYSTITSNILKKLILEGKPNWEKLILN
jgi:hypothetical protein